MPLLAVVSMPTDSVSVATHYRCLQYAVVVAAAAEQIVAKASSLTTPAGDGFANDAEAAFELLLRLRVNDHHHPVAGGGDAGAGGLVAEPAPIARQHNQSFHLRDSQPEKAAPVAVAVVSAGAVSVAVAV